jgi:hypothetical protein
VTTLIIIKALHHDFPIRKAPCPTLTDRCLGRRRPHLLVLVASRAALHILHQPPPDTDFAPSAASYIAHSDAHQACTRLLRQSLSSRCSALAVFRYPSHIIHTQAMIHTPKYKPDEGDRACRTPPQDRYGKVSTSAFAHPTLNTLRVLPAHTYLGTLRPLPATQPTLQRFPRSTLARHLRKTNEAAASRVPISPVRYKVTSDTLKRPLHHYHSPKPISPFSTV